MLVLGIAGFSLGLFGVGLAIWWTSGVLVTRIVSIATLRADVKATEFLNSHPDIVGPQYASFDAYMNEREIAWRDWAAGRPANTSEDAWKEIKAALLNRVERVEQIATRVARVWRFEKVCRTFSEARGAAFIGAVIAAVGVLLFTYATQTEGQHYFAKSPTAVAVAYDLNPQSHQILLADVAKECLPASGVATLLDGWPGGSDLLIVGDLSRCPPLRLRWTDALGSLKVTQMANASALSAKPP